MKYLFLVLFLSNPILALAAQEGEPAPNCDATLAEKSQKLDFNNYTNKVILIDFWATWCPPCKKSMPFLNSLRNEHLQEGFEIIAINVDENSEIAKQYLNENPVNYVKAFDPNGDCPVKFDVKAMPSSYLVDKSGKIRLVHLGFRDEDKAMLQKQVSSLLAE